MKATTLIVIFIFLFSFTGTTQNILVENATVVDVTTGNLLNNRHILVENGLITKVSSKKIKNANVTQTIDASGKYIMPGMIDTHIHFFQTGSIYTRPDAIDLTHEFSYKDEIDFAFNMANDSFKRYLHLGITTVVDVGGPFSNFKIRDSIAKQEMAPNVVLTGPLFSPYQPEAFAKVADVPIEKIKTIEDATALFNKMLPYKPDFIKIWYISSQTEPAEKNYPVVQHIIKMAHDNNLKVAVHATQLNTAILAVKAGADILVHSVDDKPVTEAFAKMLVKNNVAYNPTMVVSRNYAEVFSGAPENHPQDLFYANPTVYNTTNHAKKYTTENVPKTIERFKERKDAIFKYHNENISLMESNLLFLRDRGVNIITGTDAGNIGTMHASSYIQEQEAMLKAGMTIPEILKASTINAAKGFGLDTAIGTIEKGKKADFLILKNNPLTDLKNISSIEKTIKDGVLINTNDSFKETPEQVVQRQVNAYNARNIDAFMDTYADDIKIYDFPEKLSMGNKAEMRKTFSNMFERVPNLYCEIKNRIVLGNKVVDREYVRFGDQYSSVIAIYEVTDGKISKVTFLDE